MERLGCVGCFPLAFRIHTRGSKDPGLCDVLRLCGHAAPWTFDCLLSRSCIWIILAEDYLAAGIENLLV